MAIIERAGAFMTPLPWAEISSPERTMQECLLSAGTFGDVGRALAVLAPGLRQGIPVETIQSVEKVAGGFNTVVEVTIRGEDRTVRVLTFMGPRGRMKRVFAVLGFKL